MTWVNICCLIVVVALAMTVDAGGERSRRADHTPPTPSSPDPLDGFEQRLAESEADAAILTGGKDLGNRNRRAPSPAPTKPTTGGGTWWSAWWPIFPDVHAVRERLVVRPILYACVLVLALLAFGVALDALRRQCFSRWLTWWGRRTAKKP